MLEGAKTTEEAIKVITEREEYLASCHGNLKYRDNESDLISSIETAQTSGKNSGNLVQIAQDVQHAIDHIAKYEIMPQEQVIKTLKGSKDLISASKHLVTVCQDHHVEMVKGNIETIRDCYSIEVGDRKFYCPLEYLEHEIKRPTHEYCNTQSLRKLQLQLQKQLELRMQGPGL